MTTPEPKHTLTTTAGIPVGDMQHSYREMLSPIDSDRYICKERGGR
jgi:hypothetical protein